MAMIEIFRGGRQTDKSGHTHDGDRLIDAAVATFDEAVHRPPLVLGHPKEDSPAYGWVRGLQARVENGVKRLFADIEPVGALKGWVNAGLYKNRSAAFYADGRLRHVGFLGGTPPAVKGLSPLPVFSDDAEVIEFTGGHRQPLKPSFQTLTNGGSKMKFSEFLEAINIFKKLGGTDEDIDRIVPQAPEPPPASSREKTFSEADIEAARKEAAVEAKRQAQAEFAEAENKRRKAARKEEIRKFCEDGVKAGTIAPAWVDAGIAQFMEELPAGSDALVAFSEGGEKKTPAAWFAEFLEGLPKLVDFSEVAGRGTDTGGGDAGAKLTELTRKKMQENPTMQYSAAFAEVQREHPDLTREYAAEIGIGG